MTVQFHLIRLEDEEDWTLEVVNSEGMSTLWDFSFDDDADAYAEFKWVTAEEGIRAFDGSTPPAASNVFPFRRPL